jgi:hypothetical protein
MIFGFLIKQHTQNLTKTNGVWWKDDKLEIPNDETIIDKILLASHDGYLAGHFGRTKTYDLVARSYWWPQMRVVVTQHCKTCDSCQRTKNHNQKSAGLYQPLPIPYIPWYTVTMDLIVELPKT